MIVRLKCKDEETLWKRMDAEGKSRGWPGLGENVTKICDEIGIADVNNEAVPTKVIKKSNIQSSLRRYEERIGKINKT